MLSWAKKVNAIGFFLANSIFILGQIPFKNDLVMPFCLNFKQFLNSPRKLILSILFVLVE